MEQHTHTRCLSRERERDIVCSWRNPYGRRVAVYITLRKKIGIIGISREVDLIKINGCGREATRAHAPLSYPKFLLVAYNWLSFEREKDQNNNPQKINNTISLLSLLAYEVYAHCFSQGTKACRHLMFILWENTRNSRHCVRGACAAG